MTGNLTDGRYQPSKKSVLEDPLFHHYLLVRLCNFIRVWFVGIAFVFVFAFPVVVWTLGFILSSLRFCVMFKPEDDIVLKCT